MKCSVFVMGGHPCTVDPLWRITNDGSNITLTCGLHLNGVAKMLARDGASDIRLEYLGAT